MRTSAKETTDNLQRRNFARRNRPRLFRSSRKTGLLLLLATLALVVPATTKTVHGTSGALYVTPASVLPHSMGTNFTVRIKVSGVGNFTGWNISVQSDPTIIKPVSIDVTGNLLAVNYSRPVNVLASCVNNSTGLGCNPAVDGPGIVTSTTYTFGAAPAPPTLDGLLFSITYKVIAVGGFSLIRMINDQLSNGQYLVSHSTQDGMYGIGSGFDIGASPTSMNIRLGLNGTAAVTLSSINQFTGSVNLTARGGISASFDQKTLLVPSGGSKSTTVTFQTTKSTLATEYLMIITGSKNDVLVSILIDVTVIDLPSFTIGTKPGTLLLHQGTSGSSVINAQSVDGFSGDVSLTVASPQGVAVALNTTILTITPEKQAEAAVTITVPLSQLAFKYLINVTAIGGSLPPVVSPIIVRPPPASFSASVKPSSMTIRAGSSASSTITISSQDYLLGFVYIGAVMNGGAANLTTTRVFVLPSSSANSTVNVAIGTGAVPGHYILLLTLYQVGGQTTNVPVNIIVTGAVVHSGSLILGLSPPVYFGILGVLAVLLALLSVQTYRKSRED